MQQSAGSEIDQRVFVGYTDLPRQRYGKGADIHRMGVCVIVERGYLHKVEKRVTPLKNVIDRILDQILTATNVFGVRGIRHEFLDQRFGSVIQDRRLLGLFDFRISQNFRQVFFDILLVGFARFIADVDCGDAVLHQFGARFFGEREGLSAIEHDLFSRVDVDVEIQDFVEP